MLQRLKEWVCCAIFMGCRFGSYFCVGWFLSCKIKKCTQKVDKCMGIFGVFVNLLVLVGFSVADFAFYVQVLVCVQSRFYACYIHVELRFQKRVYFQETL
jgi:hypothetical protein